MANVRLLAYKLVDSDCGVGKTPVIVMVRTYIHQDNEALRVAIDCEELGYVVDLSTYEDTKEDPDWVELVNRFEKFKLENSI